VGGGGCAPPAGQDHQLRLRRGRTLAGGTGIQAWRDLSDWLATIARCEVGVEDLELARTMRILEARQQLVAAPSNDSSKEFIGDEPRARALASARDF
jgi:hypothetical protein